MRSTRKTNLRIGKCALRRPRRLSYSTDKRASSYREKSFAGADSFKGRNNRVKLNYRGFFRMALDYYLVLFSLLLLLFLAACSSTPPVYERGPLVDLILKARPGYQGLTSQRCEQWAKPKVGETKRKCLKKDVKVFDLADDKQRLQLHGLRFVCDVMGRRYRICKEIHGLCQQTTVRSGFLGMGREIKLTSVLTVEENMQFLIDSDTTCLSQSSPLYKE